jgi:catechol 2,3-dioxygenase-like lactoylglutathione lyase family enzyme
MKAAIDRLVSQYDAGAISRRDFVGAIALMAAGGGASQKESKPRLPVRTLNHVTLFVSSVDDSVKFYQDLLGMPVMSRQENGINLGAGDSFVGIYAAGSESPPHINHFCLGVEGFDADQVMKVCAEHGVESRLRRRGEVKELYFHDRDGITVQLQDVSYRG